MYHFNTIYSMADKIRKGSDLYQEALIWMGYRYAIGLTEGIRKQADQSIEQYKLFRDIEYDTPEFHSLSLEISKLQDEHDPIDYLMEFLRQNQIFTNEQLKEYKEIEVIKQSDGTITFYSEKATDINMYHMDVFSLSFYDYLGWTDLASYFDTKSHKRCKTSYKGEEKIIEYFDSWTPDNYSETKLSFHKVKRPIDSYEKRPYSCTYIVDEYIVEDNI